MDMKKKNLGEIIISNHHSIITAKRYLYYLAVGL